MCHGTSILLVVWPSRYAIAATRRLVPGRDAKNSYMA